ncbi:UDP-4-amino-4,6-dideoxy-N-acetyl-beta-L-altrosamine N-acetyltransferase [Stutzerimonas stutzeri]
MTLVPQQRVRPMTAADLEKVLAWRNHPDIRRYMYTQHEISLEEHARWFEKASRDAGLHLLVFESGAMPFGFVKIQQIAPGGVGEWGFYAAPDAPKGTGRQLGLAALRYAFTKAAMHKLCGQAMIYNERSIRFHQTLGFQKEGLLRQHHFDGLSYHDVVCFGLLANEWQANL